MRILVVVVQESTCEFACVIWQGICHLSIQPCLRYADCADCAVDFWHCGALSAHQCPTHTPAAQTDRPL